MDAIQITVVSETSTKKSLSLNSVKCMSRLLKELRNKRCHFDKHFEIVICRELVIWCYQNQGSTTFIFKVTAKSWT